MASSTIWKFLPKLDDRAADSGFLAFAHAHLARDLVGDRLTGSPAHELERLVHLVVVHDLQEGRLFQLVSSDEGTEHPVELRVAGGVGEIGQHQHVLIGERFGPRTLPPQYAAHDTSPTHPPL